MILSFMAALPLRRQTDGRTSAPISTTHPPFAAANLTMIRGRGLVGGGGEGMWGVGGRVIHGCGDGGSLGAV